jgi:hypothetical protein
MRPPDVVAGAGRSDRRCAFLQHAVDTESVPVRITRR